MLKYHESDNPHHLPWSGHRASGKTSLADAPLCTRSPTRLDRMGNVDDGTSVSDFDEEEHKHHFSVDTSVLHLEHEGRFVHMLDAPGPTRTSSGRALGGPERGRDGPSIVVSAAKRGSRSTHPPDVRGRPANTNLTRLIVVNKCDGRTNISLPGTDRRHPGDVRQRSASLFNVPDGARGRTSRGVVGVLEPPEKDAARVPRRFRIGRAPSPTGGRHPSSATRG